MPIKRGYLTESINGTPVAPLMGTYTAYDGGQTALGFNPISYVMASNDHAVMFLFAPCGGSGTKTPAGCLSTENTEGALASRFHRRLSKDR